MMMDCQLNYNAKQREIAENTFWAYIYTLWSLLCQLPICFTVTNVSMQKANTQRLKGLDDGCCRIRMRMRISSRRRNRNRNRAWRLSRLILVLVAIVRPFG